MKLDLRKKLIQLRLVNKKNVARFIKQLGQHSKEKVNKVRLNYKF